MRTLNKTGRNDEMWVHWVVSPGAQRLHEMGFLKKQHPKVTERVRPETEAGDSLKFRCLITGFIESHIVGIVGH